MKKTDTERLKKIVSLWSALSEEIADVIFDDMAPFVEQVKNILAK